MPWFHGALSLIALLKKPVSLRAIYRSFFRYWYCTIGTGNSFPACFEILPSHLPYLPFYLFCLYNHTTGCLGVQNVPTNYVCKKRESSYFSLFSYFKGFCAGALATWILVVSALFRIKAQVRTFGVNHYIFCALIAFCTCFS